MDDLYHTTYPVAVWVNYRDAGDVSGGELSSLQIVLCQVGCKASQTALLFLGLGSTPDCQQRLCRNNSEKGLLSDKWIGGGFPYVSRQRTLSLAVKFSSPPLP